MSEHSQEPWKWQETGPIDAYIVAADGSRIVGGENCEGYVSEDDPNIRRIVACVNFCARIPTETIERLLEKKLAAATAIKLLREWEENDDEDALCCPSCGHFYTVHADDCLLKPLVDAAKEIE